MSYARGVPLETIAPLAACVAENLTQYGYSVECVMDFDWDPRKARTNLAQHNVDFSEAKLVFKDPFAIDFEDDREDYGEERRTILGMVGIRLLFVVYTMQDENTVRLISARKATRSERRAYHEEQR